MRNPATALVLLLALSTEAGGQSPPVPALASIPGWGDCSGNIDARWLEDGRKMMLLADYLYTDPASTSWLAPKGAEIDGASIPQALWSFIGGPFEGLYRKASVVHDVGCDEKKAEWRAVQRPLTTKGATRIDKVISVFADLPDTEYVISPFAAPSDDKALAELSRQRASAVADHLVQYGVRDSQVRFAPARIQPTLDKLPAETQLWQEIIIREGL